MNSKNEVDLGLECPRCGSRNVRHDAWETTICDECDFHDAFGDEFIECEEE